MPFLVEPNKFLEYQSVQLVKTHNISSFSICYKRNVKHICYMYTHFSVAHNIMCVHFTWTVLHVQCMHEVTKVILCNSFL